MLNFQRITPSLEWLTFLFFQIAATNPSETAEKVAQLLNPVAATNAAKKGNAFTGEIYKRTRLGSDLKPEDPTKANFNLKNLTTAASADQLKYLFAKFGDLVEAQFDRLDLSLQKRGDCVATLLKTFQKCGVFATVDSGIFLAAPNKVTNVAKF